MANPFLAAADLIAPQASFYKGAAYNRLNADWHQWRLSADLAMRYDLQALRNRSRELVANNSTATAIPKILAENIIGKDGIVLQARIESTRGNLNKDACDRIEDGFAEWSEKGNCTADGQGSFVEAQRLWVETECTDGETILNHVQGYDNPWGYAIDTVDADQLDNTYNIVGGGTQPSVRMGVEVDGYNKPQGYWMWTAHPSEPQGRTRVRVDPDRVEHIYQQIRPKATRGPTWFAPVIFDLNMLGGFRDAHVTAARIAACAMGFFTQDENSPGGLQPTNGSATVDMRMQPGLMKQLPVGTKFEGWEPQYPNAQFGPFDMAMQRGISSGMRMSYMSLSNDLNATSFASGRIGILAERAVYQYLQQRFIRLVLIPIYRRWLRMAMLSGALKLPSMDPRTYWKVTWHPRAFPWIDPSKDIDLAERSVAMGIDSLTRICAEQGRDFEEVLKQRSDEIKLAEKYNVPLVIAAGKAKPIDVDTTQEAEDDAAGGTPDGDMSPAPAKPPKPSRNGNGKNGANGHHPRIPVLT